MREAARRGFSTATDLADYLVGLGLPFRDAHEVVGKAVAHGVESGLDLAEMDLATLQGFCADIQGDVFDVLTLEGSVAARDHLGGTAPQQVAAAACRQRAPGDALTQSAAQRPSSAGSPGKSHPARFPPGYPLPR